jgi:hypothetical protein
MCFHSVVIGTLFSALCAYLCALHYVCVQVYFAISPVLEPSACAVADPNSRRDGLHLQLFMVCSRNGSGSAAWCTLAATCLCTADCCTALCGSTNVLRASEVVKHGAGLPAAVMLLLHTPGPVLDDYSVAMQLEHVECGLNVVPCDVVWCVCNMRLHV